MKLSILICSYNKSYHLKAILKSLNYQDVDRSLFEVCLIIDGSTDDTIDVLKDIKVNYTLAYHYIENSGLTKARNYGIDLCKGEYILFCDDDVLLKPDFISNIIISISNNPESVHIGNLVNIRLDKTREILDDINLRDIFNYSSYVESITEHVFFDAAKVLFKSSENDNEFKSTTWWAVVTGGNLCMSSECFKKAGKFDNNIQGWGPEDADLCYRIFMNGYDAKYNKDCILFHLDHKRNSMKIAETMTRNAFYFYRKHDKPAELSFYLKFMNGVLSLKEFNDACCDIFNIKKIDVSEFYMSMKNYTNVTIPTFIKSDV